MSIDLFFGTPLVVRDAEPDVCDSIRSKVHSYLESEQARRDVVPAPEESVTTSYFKREASILVDAGLEELEAMILATAKNYLEQTLKLPPRALEVEQAWINVFEPGSQEGQHTHDGSLLSCSYYVEAPKDCGCIVFPDPIGARRSYREFTKTSGKDLLTRSDMAVEPRPGRLVMFESWMPHYIQCNKSDEVRISIAINLREAVHSASSAPNKDAKSVEEQTEEAGRAQTNRTSRPAPRPFLFNELFEVNKDLHLELQSIREQIPVAVIDNLLKDPAEVREVIGSAPAANWKHEPGGRNFVDYYDCRLRFPIRYPNGLVSVAQQVIQNVAKVQTRPADASVDVNWFMQINARRADFAVPHSDITENVSRSFTCVLFLNDPEECSGGTGFFQFKPTGSLLFDEKYARAVTSDTRIGESGLDYWPETTREMWEQIGSIDMRQGRMMVFPSEYFHSAWHPVDSFYEFPRLTLAFWMIT